MYFCVIYNNLYNLQLCLTCMEMKLMDNKILLNLKSTELLNKYNNKTFIIYIQKKVILFI